MLSDIFTPKPVNVDESANDCFVDIFVFREADSLASQALYASAKGQMVSFDLLGITLTHKELILWYPATVCEIMIGIADMDVERL